jgi:hypothetical protein
MGVSACPLQLGDEVALKGKKSGETNPIPMREALAGLRV